MSERIRYHTDLRVWQLSRAIAVAAYKASAQFPSEERYALTDQVRRCAVSVPANIAEGVDVVRPRNSYAACELRAVRCRSPIRIW
jgi:four helix bundle protein